MTVPSFVGVQAENESSLENRIQPYHKNPMYWQYKGKPVLLFGGTDRDNIFQWANQGTRLIDELNLLKSCGGNYVRCTISSREYTPTAHRWDLLPYPFKKLPSGKYDLDQWDETYWDKLRTTFQETARRDIIAQVEIWDMWNESGDSEDPVGGLGWYCTPWNPNNNINYTWEDSPLLQRGKTPFYNPFFNAVLTNDPVLLPYQRKFIGRIIDESLASDNILYQIDNESGIDLAVGDYWARFIYERAGAAHKNVYVCDSRSLHWPSIYVTTVFQDFENPEIKTIITNPDLYRFCELSQNTGNSRQVQYDNLLWYRSKVKQFGMRPINHVKCYHFNWPTGGEYTKVRTSPSDAEAGAKFWRAVFGGAASIRFHRNSLFKQGGLKDGFGLTPEGQTHMRSMRMFVDAVDLFRMEPDNSILVDRTENEAYALVNPAREYAVYFTGEGDCQVGIDLTAVTQPLTETWLDVMGNVWSTGKTVESGKFHTLSCPNPGQWVVLLKRAGAGSTR
jgi:hypothetical protein